MFLVGTFYRENKNGSPDIKNNVEQKPEPDQE